MASGFARRGAASATPLVYLRKGEFKRAIADYDAALRLEQLPWALYGRGVARMRSGDPAAGQADIAAATALYKNIGVTAARYGINSLRGPAHFGLAALVRGVSTQLL